MAESRLLKYARANPCVLRLNQRHLIAANHSLKIYKSNAIYSFIPKNACSTMRLSLAVANCCIPDSSHIDWIHDNNDTFRASLEDLVTARYTFVILRDPLARLASCFLDKIVSKAVPARRLRELTEPALDLDELSFSRFVALLGDPAVLSGNMHWRPQTDFLVYERYDDYFAVEHFAAAAAALRDRAGLEIIDARPFTAHGLDHFDLLPVDADHSLTPVREIARLRQRGQCPDPRSLYTPRLVDDAMRLFADDVALYRELIGPLTFVPAASPA